MPSGEIPVKNTGFFPRYSAPKRHSNLFLRTFLCINTHIPPPPGLPYPACPHPARPHLAQPTRPASTRPAPARCATCDRIFPSVPNFSRVQPIFSLVLQDFPQVLQDFSLVPEPDFSLTYCVDATLQRRAERCAPASC